MYPYSKDCKRGPERLSAAHFENLSEPDGEYWFLKTNLHFWAPPDCCHRYLCWQLDELGLADEAHDAELEDRTAMFITFKTAVARDRFVDSFNRLMDQEWEEWRYYRESERQSTGWRAWSAYVGYYWWRLRLLLKESGPTTLLKGDRPVSR